jgi:hypothetical protein
VSVTSAANTNAGSSVAPLPPPDPSLARAVTHAVYLTGGLVLLALAISELASGVSTLAQCEANNVACVGGQVYYSVGAGLGAGVVLLVVAIVLLVLAKAAH